MAPVHENTFVSPAAQTVPKRIIVCCDGTWQSSTSLDPQHAIPSNVTRLCRVLAKAGEDKDKKTWQQIVYYDAGVGTGDLTDFEKGRQGELAFHTRTRPVMHSWDLRRFQRPFLAYKSPFSSFSLAFRRMSYLRHIGDYFFAAELSNSS